MTWRSLGDSNPCFRRERASSARPRSDPLGSPGRIRIRDQPVKLSFPPLASVRCSCHSSQAMVRENAGQDMRDMCSPPFERFLALGHELVPLVHCGYTGDRS
jgi:hypothetical protein